MASLARGDRLGPYEILAPIGAGGMGEVYRARDTRLGREVAIKCLLPEVATDGRRRDRFAVEAQAISRLTHPHICTLHDLAYEGDHVFLVMEFVEGQTLSQRLSRSPAGMDRDEALSIAAELADALAFAHRQQIVHRDVKPSNIILARSGIKLLDFGLAKLRETPGDADDGQPTRTLLTGAHEVMGTLPYMAPEQLEGRSDARTDIFACGAVIFEMLTGRRAFDGTSSTTLMASIVSHDPLSGATDSELPDGLRRLLRRCLRKDPEDRWQSAADLADELRWIRESLSRSPEPAATAVPASRSASRRKLLMYGLWATAVAIATGVLAFVGWRMPPAPAPASQTSSAAPLRLTVALPANAVVANDLSISADGQQIVYASPADSTRPARLYLRRLSALEPRPIDGTDGAAGPFFSPDGTAVGFFAAGALKRVSLADGTISTICSVPEGSGARGTWSADGTIVFSAPQSERAGLFRVAASGGSPAVLTTPADTEGNHTAPWFIPGSRHVLYVTARTRAGTSPALMLHSLDTGQSRRLAEGPAASVVYSGAFVAMPRYVQGHLLYLDGRRVMAAPFDLETTSLTGAPVPLVDDASVFEVSASGRLLYVPVERGGRVVSVQRDGSTEVLLDDGRRYEMPRVSPNGGDLAVMILRESRSDVAVYHLARRTLSARLTTDGSNNSPTWSPDGRDIVYRAPGKLLIQPADGSRAPVVFLESQDPRLAGTSSLAPGAFVPDGSAYLFVVHSATGTGADIWKLELTGQRRAIPLMQRAREQWAVRVSPDGRWMSYTSNESGQFEIYVSPLAGNGPAIKVSADGGREAVWSPRGDELFYRVGDRMMAVPINASTTTPAGEPRLLFTGQYVSSDLPHYAVTADGQRFIMIQAAEAGRAIHVVDHAIPR